MMRQAVILAAGRGTRMKNAGNPDLANLPKPLLEINKVPIIKRIVRKLTDSGLDIAIVINPNDESAFRKSLKEYKITYCYQEKALGTANALFCAKDFVRDELFLVLMGDDISDYSLDMVLNASRPTVFGFEVGDVSRYGAIVVNKNSEVEDILEKQKSGKGLANTGIYIMPKLFFDIYKEIPLDEKKGEYFLTHAPRIMKRHGVSFAMKKVDFWQGINTPEDLEKASSR